MKQEILDCHDLTAEQIVDYMIELNPSLRSLIKRQKVYVGATGNIEERLSRHNAKRILFCARTASQRVAAARGFNIGKVTHGGNGTNSHSIYVYAFEID